MAYLKPPAFTRRLANPLALRLNARGVATLTLARRRTGETRKVPVIPVSAGGSRYLVSPYCESDWVRNLRAAGKGELSREGRSDAVPCDRVQAGSRRAVMQRVLTGWGPASVADLSAGAGLLAVLRRGCLR